MPVYELLDRVVLRCGKNAIVNQERSVDGFYLFFIMDTGEVVRLHEWNIAGPLREVNAFYNN